MVHVIFTIFFLTYFCYNFNVLIYKFNFFQVLNQVENESNEVISNFDETPWPPLTNSTQIFENKKKSGLDEDQLYGEYVIQRLKNIKNTTVKQLVKLEIDYIFYNKMKQLLQENTK